MLHLIHFYLFHSSSHFLCFSNPFKFGLWILIVIVIHNTYTQTHKCTSYSLTLVSFDSSTCLQTFYLKTSQIHNVVCLHFLLFTSCYLILIVGSDPRIYRGTRDYRIQLVIMLVVFRQPYIWNFTCVASFSCREVYIV